jgi:hypothetical protein
MLTVAGAFLYLHRIPCAGGFSAIPRATPVSWLPLETLPCDSASGKCSPDSEGSAREIGKHPELGAAITKPEMALNILVVKTGGMLWRQTVGSRLPIMAIISISYRLRIPRTICMCVFL